MGKEQLKLHDKKAAAAKNEIVINRLMMVFALAITIVTILIVNSNPGMDSMSNLRDQLSVFAYISGAAVVFAAVFLIIRLIKRTDETLKTLNSKHIFVISVIIFAGGLILRARLHDIIGTLIAAVITLTLLYFIHYLYRREYMITAVVCAFSAFSIYFSASATVYGTAAKIFAAAVPLILVAFTLFIRANGGEFRGSKILKNRRSYIHFFLAGAALLIAAGVNFIAAGLTVYIVCAVIAFALIYGIIYTIKMM